MIHKYAEIFCWKNVSSFCSAKATHIISAKNIRILHIEAAKTVNENTLNELVKLTTLWTTGPWWLKVALRDSTLTPSLGFVVVKVWPIFRERNCPFGILLVVFWLWCRCYKCVLLSLWFLGRNVLGYCIDSWSYLVAFLFMRMLRFYRIYGQKLVSNRKVRTRTCSGLLAICFISCLVLFWSCVLQSF